MASASFELGGANDNEALFGVHTGLEVSGGGASQLRERAHRAEKRVRDAVRMPKNMWRVGLSALTTGFCAFVFYTASTLVRGLYGDLWYGPVTIGGTFAAMTLLSSVFLGKGVIPVFDLTTIILNLRILNFKARSTDNNKERVIRSQLELVPALFLAISLLGAGFASAGICRAVLGATLYNGVAKIPTDPTQFNDGKVFFIEFFAMVVYAVFIQQLTLTGVNIAHISILSGFWMTAMQAMGYDISSACYNFVYWLTVNTVGFHAHFWVGWWIYPVAALSTIASVWIINKVIFFFYNKSIKRNAQIAAKIHNT